MSARRWPLAAAVAVTIAAATTAGLKSRTTSDQPLALSPELLALSPEPSALRQTPASGLQPLISIDVHVTADGAPVADLTQGDFALFEDKAPRPIERFAHAVSGDAHPRAFVVFLDSGHLIVDDRHRLFDPLVSALDKAIAPGDLVAVMTPTMPFKDVTFVPKAASVRRVLETYWPWGGADRTGALDDPLDDLYRTCYPPAKEAQVASQMIDRSREKTTLDALERLAAGLRGARQSRTAIVAVTDGWTILRPDGGLARPILTSGRPRTVPGNFVPGGGAPGAEDKAAARRQPTPCDPDRVDLAKFDGEPIFNRLMDEANGADASFYPISGAALVADPSRRRGGRETDSLRALAGATDGVAAVSGGELDAALTRIASDQSSYYVIGFRSPVASDGRFHAIDVKVARPGAVVRARRGYLVPASAAPATGTSAGGEARIERRDMDAAIAPLDGFSRDAPFRLDAASGWMPTGAAAFWAVGEVGGASADDWLGGADADVTLEDAAGTTIASAHVQVDPGGHSFRVALAPRATPAPGEFEVRVRIQSPGAAKPIDATTQVALRRAPAGSGVVIYRRGPTTGHKDLPTADRRFRRSDRIRVEIPAGSAGAASARLLDRTGAPKPVPVAASVRDDADGARWLTAELALVPLAPGDYVIEVKGGSGTRVLVPFRMVP